MRQLVTGVDVPSQKVRTQSGGQQELVTVGNPLLVVRFPNFVSRGNEVLDFHLLEFATAENEIAGRDFVPKGLAGLGNAKGNFLAAGRDDIFEIQKNALGRFGSQVRRGRRIRDGSDLCLEHKVKVPGHGQCIGFARGWTRNEGHESFIRFGQFGKLEGLKFNLRGSGLRLLEPCFGLRSRGFDHVLIVAFLNANITMHNIMILILSNEFDLGVVQLIGTIPQFCFFAIYHGIRKAVHMTFFARIDQKFHTLQVKYSKKEPERERESERGKRAERGLKEPQNQ